MINAEIRRFGEYEAFVSRQGEQKENRKKDRVVDAVGLSVAQPCKARASRAPAQGI